MIGYAREGVQHLRQILELGSTTLLDRYFMDKLNEVPTLEQPRMRTGP